MILQDMIKHGEEMLKTSKIIISYPSKSLWHSLWKGREHMGTKGDAVGSVNNCNSYQILFDIMDWDHLLYVTFLSGKTSKEWADLPFSLLLVIFNTMRHCFPVLTFRFLFNNKKNLNRRSVCFKFSIILNAMILKLVRNKLL